MQFVLGRGHNTLDLIQCGDEKKWQQEDPVAPQHQVLNYRACPDS